MCVEWVGGGAKVGIAMVGGGAKRAINFPAVHADRNYSTLVCLCIAMVVGGRKGQLTFRQSMQAGTTQVCLCIVRQREKDYIKQLQLCIH